MKKILCIMVMMAGCHYDNPNWCEQATMLWSADQGIKPTHAHCVELSATTATCAVSVGSKEYILSCKKEKFSCKLMGKE